MQLFEWLQKTLIELFTEGHEQFGWDINMIFAECQFKKMKKKADELFSALPTPF